MKKKQNNIPIVRFPEFKDEWEYKELNEIAIRVTKKNVDFSVKKVLTNSAINGIVLQDDYFDKKIANNTNLNNYYVAEENDFIYNPRISLYAPVGPLKRNKLDKGVLSPLYTVLRFNKGIISFFEYYFDTTFWHRYMKSIANYGARFDRMNITNDSLFKLPVPYPTIPEQKRIADFFTVLDKKINRLKEKKALLEAYKKGMMQKIFSQEIRFKDDNGNDFPEWEEKKLGEIGKTFNGLSGKTKDDFGKGFPYIQYKQIFKSSVIDISECEFVMITENEQQNTVKYGDVFFTTSSETLTEIGFSSVLLADVENMYLNSFCFGYRINNHNILKPEFAQYLFRNQYFRKDVIKLGQGSTRYNMSKNELMQIKILLPKEKEQTKIANFLTKIDEKINTVNKQIELTKEYKKGLLQRMFV